MLFILNDFITLRKVLYTLKLFVLIVKMLLKSAEQNDVTFYYLTALDAHSFSSDRSKFRVTFLRTSLNLQKLVTFSLQSNSVSITTTSS